jgi:hypothetical protein
MNALGFWLTFPRNIRLPYRIFMFEIEQFRENQLKGPAPIFYIISPEGNSAAMRKLKGSALALGQCVKVVDQINSLPSIPEPNSVLLLPDSMKLPHSDDHGSSWDHIYILSNQASKKLSGNSKITLSSEQAGLTLDLKLLHALMHAYGIHPQSSWYASSISISCGISQSHTNLLPWAKQHRIVNYPSFTSIAKGLALLSEKLGERITTYDLSTDGLVLDFKVTCDTKSEDEQLLIADLLTPAAASVVVIRRSHTQISLRIIIELNGAQSRLIKIVTNTENTNSDAENTSEQEAS